MKMKIISSQCPLVYDYCALFLSLLKALEILSGATILVVGVFLGAIQGIFQLFEQYSYFTLYTGYPIWGPLFVSIPVPLNRDHSLATTARKVFAYLSIVLRVFESYLLGV